MNVWTDILDLTGVITTATGFLFIESESMISSLWFVIGALCFMSSFLVRVIHEKRIARLLDGIREKARR